MKRCHPFTRDSLKNVDNKEGMYELYSKRGERLYVGSSKRLRHRLQSYREKDDYSAHPTKRKLRGKLHCAKVTYLPIEQARQKERSKKKDCKYNFK